MKKYAFIFAAIACLGLAASCQKENTPAEDNTNVITFTASIDPVGGVKPGKAVIDGVTPKWETGDAIRLYPFSTSLADNTYAANATNPSFKVSKSLTAGGSSSATFTFNVTGTMDQADCYLASFGEIPTTVKWSKKDGTQGPRIRMSHLGAVKESPQNKGTIHTRVACGVGGTLAFKNVWSLVRYTPVCPDATYAVLSSLDGTTPVTNQVVDIVFNPATGDIESLTHVGDDRVVVYAEVTSGEENYFALAPGMTITGGFKIELKNASDATVQTFTYAHDLTTSRNRIITISNFDDRVVDAAGKAVLQNGQSFNVALKKLADGGDPYYHSNNTSITSIVVDTRSSVNTGTVVSATSSAVPIYANFDDVSGVMTLSTPANKIYFPASANRSFYCLKGISSIDMSKMILEDVTNASDMFRMCDALTSFGNIDLPNATNTTYMFSDCTSLETVGTLNLPLVDLTNNMFSGCSKLQSMGDVDLPSASAVRSMFYNCTVLASVGSVNMPLVTDANALFKECNALATIGPIQMPAVANAGQMFSGCRELTSLTLNGVDNNTLTNLNDMFSSCAKLTTLNFTPVSDKVTTTASMFYDCESLSSVDISHISGNLTAVASMFRYCYNLDGIVFNSGFNTSGVTSFLSMFDNCRSLTSLDLSMFDTSAAESMSQMFNNCRELTTIGATTRFVTTASLTNTASMFAGCLKLASVDLTGLAAHPTSMQSMFSSCQSLTTIHLSNDFNTEAVSSYASVFDFCTSLNQLYIKGFHLTKGVIGTNSSQLTSRFMNALRNVPSSCTIHYTTNNSSTEYDVRYYLPYSTTTGTGTGGYNWTTAN